MEVTMITRVNRETKEWIDRVVSADSELRARINQRNDDIDAGDPEQLLAGQIVMIVLLRATIYECDETSEQVPDPPVSVPKPDFPRTPLLDDILRELPADKLTAITDLRHQLLAASEPAQAIGSVYETVMPDDYLMKQGQFWTPRHIADVMGAWVVTSGGERIVDPGVGSGMLSVATACQAENIRDCNSIYGVDTSPLACAMAYTAMSLESVSIDFDVAIRRFADLDGAFDGLIANPPYLRQHRLTPEQKQHWQSRIKRAHGRDVTRHTPLHVYWMYEAASLLAPGGAAAIIVPAEVFQTNYGEDLKKHLLAEFNIEALLHCDQPDSVFPGADITPVVCCLQKPETGDASTPTRLVRVDEWPGSDTVLSALASTQSRDTDWGGVSVVQQAKLQADTDWLRRAQRSESLRTTGVCSLSEIAAVKTGIVTGDNAFFCFSEDEVAQWGIDEQYLARVISSPRMISEYTFTEHDWARLRDVGESVYLLYNVDSIDADQIADPESITDSDAVVPDGGEASSGRDDGVREYLRYGLTDAIQAHTGTAANRNPWYRVRRRDPAPILIPYMTSTEIRVIQNLSGARFLNNMLGVYPQGLDKREQIALVAFLNSAYGEEALRAAGRQYGELSKFEVSEIRDSRVLDPRALSEAGLSRLQSAFDALINTTDSGRGGAGTVSLKGRRELNAAVAQVLGGTQTDGSTLEEGR